ESKMCLPARCGVIVVRCFFKKKVETKTNIIASTKHFFYTCISSETNPSISTKEEPFDFSFPFLYPFTETL
ncbi:MAG: hypothetical protein ACXVLT_15575, partial [Flavisolibacter sp.]